MICEDAVSYDDPWKVITPECKDFVGRLLSKSPAKRMTADEALVHPWVAGNLAVCLVCSSE
ncbi:MAG: hypothetical protein P4M11_03675 [Candidatus Pacebacteria bacterium]|nr:hypothetical protein [Candidatus Paceibacterota bacterium]